MAGEQSPDVSVAAHGIASHHRAKDLFDRIAEDYQLRSDRRVASFSSLIFQRRIEIVARFIDRIATPGRTLDYGMGPAVFAKPCVERGLTYIGVDISPVMVQRAEALGLRGVEYIVGDLESLNSFEAQMDGVLAIGLLDYLEDPWGGLEALSRCVKPGGVLIVSFRNRRSLPRLLRDAARTLLRPVRRQSHRRAFLGLVHERSFDVASELVPALASSGFQNFDVDYFNCSPFFFDFTMPRGWWERWRRRDASLASKRTRYLCSGGVLIAQKRMTPAAI